MSIAHIIKRYTYVLFTYLLTYLLTYGAGLTKRGPTGNSNRGPDGSTKYALTEEHIGQAGNRPLIFCAQWASIVAFPTTFLPPN